MTVYLAHKVDVKPKTGDKVNAGQQGDITITSEVNNLLEVTENVKDWYLLGQRLGLSLEELNTIAQKCRYVKGSKLAVFQKWIENDKNASVDKLIEIIKGTFLCH